MTTVTCTASNECKYDYGEDFGRVTSSNAHSLRNVLAYVYEANTSILRWVGYTNNSGCTDAFFSNVDAFDLVVLPSYDDDDTGVHFDVQQCTYPSSGCGGTPSCATQVHVVNGFDASGGTSFNVEMWPSFDLAAYASASRTVDRFLGSYYALSSPKHSFDIRVTTASGNGCTNTLWDASSGEAIVRLDDETSRRKFTVSHELGHAFVLDRLQIEEYDLVDCSYGTGTPDNHTLFGPEYQSCADQEGFAHFVSAYVWNQTPNNANGVFVTDAQSQPFMASSHNIEGGGVKTILDTGCSGSGCLGLGTEWDWAHMWWDYRTDSGTKPSNGDLLTHYFLAENQYSWTHTSWHFTPLYYAAYFNFGYGPRFYADGNANGASIGG